MCWHVFGPLIRAGAWVSLNGSWQMSQAEMVSRLFCRKLDFLALIVSDITVGTDDVAECDNVEGVETRARAADLEYCRS